MRGGWRSSSSAPISTDSLSCPKAGSFERIFAWISNCRGLAEDFERHARKAAAFIRLATIRIMLRRLAANRNVPERFSGLYRLATARFQ